jgi:hypothetical protein
MKFEKKWLSRSEIKMGSARTHEFYKLTFLSDVGNVGTIVVIQHCPPFVERGCELPTLDCEECDILKQEMYLQLRCSLYIYILNLNENIRLVLRTLHIICFI